MGVPVKISSLSDKHIEGLMEYIQPLLDINTHNEEQDLRREAVDKAIKQDHENVELNRSRLPGQTVASDQLVRDEDEEDSYDEFSSLHEPLLLKLYRSWTTLAKSACFPNAADWMDIRRKHCRYFKKKGIQDFLPQANQAWVNIINTENQRFGFKKKYSIGIAECIAYGNTGAVHYFNPDGQYTDITFPGIRNMGVNPATNLWRQSNLIVRYDLQYAKMLKRTDFHQEFVDAIIPSMQHRDKDENTYEQGSTRKQEDDDHEIPHGHVRHFDIYIPSIYVPGENDEEPFIGENLYVTVAHNPDHKKDFEMPESMNGSLIMKIEKDVEEYDHGLLFAAAGTTLPGVFFHQGMLIPFLSHQMLLNQQMSSMGRITALIQDPPLEITRAPDADYQASPPEELVPGAQYEGFNVRAIIAAEYFQVLDTCVRVNSFVSNSVESGSGLSKPQLAGISTGRTSASEVREAVSAGGLNVQEFVDHIDNDILTPSYVLRIQNQQEQLRNQIEDQLADSPKVEGALQELLEDNKLFEKMLEFSGIEEMYEEFYEEYKNEQVENTAIGQEIVSMMQRITELHTMVQQDPPPPVASAVTIDPHTGQPSPTQAEQDQAEEAYYQQVQEQKKMALEEAKQLQIQVEQKQLELKDLIEIPEPSLPLYYEILTYPIKSSDIVATGAQTSMSKDFARQFLKEWTGFLQALGPEGMSELDTKKLIDSFTKTTNFVIGDITKDPQDKRRAESAARAEQARLQQLQEMAASNPGSQIPKVQ